MKIFRIFTLRKRLREKKEAKLHTQEYRITKSKVIQQHSFFHRLSYDVNPFITVSQTKSEIAFIDDIGIHIDGLYENPYEVKFVLQSRNLSKKVKKMIIEDLIHRWEYDYYQEVDKQLTVTLEKASYNPIKKVERIKNRTITTYILITLCFMVLLRQFSALQFLPWIGPFFKHVNTLLIYQRYYRFSLVIVYLSIFIAMFLIIVKVYFDKVQRYGLSAKGFLIKERDRMLKKLNPNKRRIKKHLMLVVKNKQPDSYPIKKIYNSKVVVDRIKRYGRKVIDQVGFFTSHYHQFLLFSKFCKLVHLGILIYLTYSLIIVNDIL
jgi:hypothetical protein